MPLQAWTGTLGFRRFRFTEFPDNQHMKLAGLSAPRTGRLYPPGKIHGIHFCQRLSGLEVIVRTDVTMMYTDMK